MSRPNFFIVGAAKSGTSAIHALLQQHPEIFMSVEKEPCYFAPQDALRNIWPDMAKNPVSHELDAYLALFADSENQKVVGESSTTYAMLPYFSGVADRIRAFNPESRILFVLRNPVQRALSHYWHRVRRGLETRTPEQALSPGSIYLSVSDYATQISEYLRHFNERRIKLILTEEFAVEPAAIYQSVCEWLEVDPSFAPDGLFEKKHVTPSDIRRARGPVGASLLLSSSRLHFLKPIIPESLIQRIKDILSPKVVTHGENFEGLIEELRDHFVPKQDRLREITGRDFSAWNLD
ncbi:MAG: sulfotransferase [Chloroflexota bacterium]|nr:sulfotransferase [Chloroflexota bacterium]